MSQYRSVILAIVLTGGSVCAQESTIVIRDDLRKHFDALGVQGSFALFDSKSKVWTVCNQAQFRRPFTPASTFKICNSLIALETGVVKDDNYTLKWDGVARGRPEWNADQDLEAAFKNSTVWYFQELARRIGGPRMKLWLDKVGYGNADTSGGIDSFWLSGGLRITPQQQIIFLKHLHDGSLPFSEHSLDVVKKIMIVKDTATYTLRAKTGLSNEGDLTIGWYIGYVETKSGVAFFATCIQRSSSGDASFSKARIEITMRILRALKIL